MKSSKVRCAMIGMGIGSLHAKAFNENMTDGELAAVADIDAARLKPWVEKLGEARCFTDYKEVLKKVKPDLAIVCLPNCLHCRATLDCLKAGAHVLCEKPMAMNVREAKRMKEAALKAKRMLGINLSFRFGREARALKDLADEGALGRPYHAYTKWTRRDWSWLFGKWFGRKELSGGGPLIDLGVHRIDLAMWLMGSPQPVTVSGAAHGHIAKAAARKRNYKADVEDFAAGCIRFDTGASLLFEASWAGFQEENEDMFTRVMGTKGALIHSWDENPPHPSKALYAHAIAGHQTVTEVTPSKDGHRGSIAEMIHCVRNNQPFLAGADDGIRVQQILDGLYKSAETGHEVRVKAL